jgi:hypothetical protein
VIKKPNRKRRKGNKTPKNEKGRIKRRRKNFVKKVIKEKEPKIKVLTHELLVFTLSYLMLASW